MDKIKHIKTNDYELENVKIFQFLEKGKFFIDGLTGSYETIEEIKKSIDDILLKLKKIS